MIEQRTLVSLAMFKVDADLRGSDYIDYIRPFCLQLLVGLKGGAITPRQMKALLKDSFGLQIPVQGVEIVLGRLAKKRVLRRAKDMFHIVEDVSRTGFEEKKAEAQRHISVVINALLEYATRQYDLELTKQEAMQWVLHFLGKFSIESLRTYLRGTALPRIPDPGTRSIFIVSKFVRDIHQTDFGLFASFVVLAKGNMLANALVCPDLDSLNKVFKRTTFYVDTPLVITMLGLAGNEILAAAQEMIELVKALSGTFAILEHTVTEVSSILNSALRDWGTPAERGTIALELRRQGKRPSDLEIISNSLESRLAEDGIEVRRTPEYIRELQIDESALELAIREEIDYLNPRALEYDLNSIRSIYVLRDDRKPTRLEDANAVLVTSNAALARCAKDFGKDGDVGRRVSSVITDFDLANTAWLKAPLQAPELPIREVLAYCYAALDPPEDIWQEYLGEASKLADDGRIGAEDLQLFRYTTAARRGVMEITLGEHGRADEDTISQVLSRIRQENIATVQAELDEERSAHERTKTASSALKHALRKQRYVWYRRTGRVGTISCGVLGVGLAVCCIAFVILGFRRGAVGLGLAVILLIGMVLCALNVLAGVTVKNICARLRDWVHLRLFGLVQRYLLPKGP